MPDAEISTVDELDRIISERLIVSRYQSIIDLGTGAPAGYEALARGPKGSPLEFPDRLFAAAREAGQLDALDAVCRRAAIEGAAGSAIDQAGGALFVNTEPDVSGCSMVETYEALLRNGGGRRVIFEFTERALTHRPADVLGAAAQLRRLGAGIALDDVGVDPRSLALLPFVQPDVVKLDMQIVHGSGSAHTAKVMHAVGAYAETSGARIVAEGIETPEHLAAARSLGATHGQGWLFSRPGPPPATLETVSPLPAWTKGDGDAPATPFQQVVQAGRPVQEGDKALILSLSRQLERHALTLGESCVVLGNLQHARHLSERTGATYSHLADHVAFAGLIGSGVARSPARGVRGGSYEPHDLLAKEWSVSVISPHFAAAILAVDLGDLGVPDMARRFAFTLTYDRTLVANASAVLMRRITAADEGQS